MTIGELEALLHACDDKSALVGACDDDDALCEVQIAALMSHHETGEQYFLIRANGGYPLFPLTVADPEQKPESDVA
jgi:hypothetical protein